MCFFNMTYLLILLLQLLSITSYCYCYTQRTVSSFTIAKYHRRSFNQQRTICLIKQSNFSLAASKDGSSDAETLREKVDELRREVSEFEEQKREEERLNQLARDKEERKKRDEKLRYSVVIPILKGDGSTEMERVEFKPRLSEKGETDVTSSRSTILAVEASLPLGIILGEDEILPGAIRVNEVTEDGNGATSGVRVGDLLRACTACQVTMEMPTWQIMAGGIGRPKTNRMMFSTDGRPFEEVMEAVGSNRLDPEQRPVWLVLERKDE